MNSDDKKSQQGPRDPKAKEAPETKTSPAGSETRQEENSKVQDNGEGEESPDEMSDTPKNKED
jgi:hypothetical protein